MHAGIHAAGLKTPPLSTQVECAPLAGLPEQLRILGLARVPISDVGVEHLGKLSVLEELDINGCTNIGSVSLGKALEKLTNLTSLDVSYCPGIL